MGFTVVCICISLMINNIEHHFMCFWSFVISSLEICLFKPFAYLLCCLSFFCLVLTLLYMFCLLDPWHIYDTQMFSPIVWIGFFHFLDSVLWHTNVFNFDKILFIDFFFSFVVCAFGIISKRLFPKPGSQRFTAVFPSKSYMVLALQLDLQSILS